MNALQRFFHFFNSAVVDTNLSKDNSLKASYIVALSFVGDSFTNIVVMHTIRRIEAKSAAFKVPFSDLSKSRFTFTGDGVYLLLNSASICSL